MKNSLFLNLNLKNILGIKVFLILLFVSVAVLLSFYAFQINEITKASYLTKIYKKQINEISQENGVLEIKRSEISTLQNIDVLVQNSNFEKVKQIKYIQVLDGAVAAK